MINKETIKQYQSLFGAEKMTALFAEFKKDVEQKLQSIENQETDILRTVFHNLRSSSKIFGMADFADLCTEIEEEILKNGKSAAVYSEIARAKKMLQKNLHEAEQIFS